ncbi:hypothetical protein HIM_05063 [Hirsutella minnesotensis 3608]|uniref:Histone chaperone domain-containing protein n=1 Tax=Hirsutella minnesotensis 3608 TaxID=1043627 RepID=A0A0F7ZPJ3_9HYPO|nr:hypothetical protein HIM_05063 [Hirsutella minnesotensis 3608]
MSGDEATLANKPSNDEPVVESKGKGKAVAEEVPESGNVNDEDEDDEDEDDEENDDNAEPGKHSHQDPPFDYHGNANHAVAEEEDGMEEIDLNNIVEGGRRTRGTKIDFAKAAEENPVEDEDEEDDDDFEPPEDTEMSG